MSALRLQVGKKIETGREGLMRQLVLRKWHRRIGITLAFFIVLQAGSGLVLVIEDKFFEKEERAEGYRHRHEHEVQGDENSWVAALHHGTYPRGFISSTDRCWLLESWLWQYLVH